MLPIHQTSSLVERYRKASKDHVHKYKLQTNHPNRATHPARGACHHAITVDFDMFPTECVIPKSLEVGHWPSEARIKQYQGRSRDHCFVDPAFNRLIKGRVVQDNGGPPSFSSLLHYSVLHLLQEIPSTCTINKNVCFCGLQFEHGQIYL